MGGRYCFASPNLLAVRGAGQSKAGQDRADRDNSDSGWNLGVVRPVRSDWGAGRQALLTLILLMPVDNYLRDEL